MTGWQVEEMVANSRNMAWEELNAPDPYEKELKEAANDIGKAVSSLDVAIGRLYDASSDLAETPIHEQVDSFIDSLLDVIADLDEIKRHWERGERE